MNKSSLIKKNLLLFRQLFLVQVFFHTFPMPKQMQPQTQLSIMTHSGKTPRARISTLRAAYVKLLKEP